MKVFVSTNTNKTELGDRTAVGGGGVFGGLRGSTM